LGIFYFNNCPIPKVIIAKTLHFKFLLREFEQSVGSKIYFEVESEKLEVGSLNTIN
jgi:hypothetical protein